MRALLLGETKIPTPSPTKASAPAIAPSEAWGARRARRTSPAARISIPRVERRREPMRSERVPLMGAATAMTSGCAVSTSPACCVSSPRPWMRRKGMRKMTL
jgi:hypothetical protein